MVSIDLIGPLTRSNSGNTWLLVMQDRFTKWVELRPLRKATSQVVATAIRDQVCLRHGSSRIIVSDNGRQFIGEEVTRLCSELHIQQRLTPTYTPQCNPVERANRVIKTMIAQIIERSQRTWDSCLAELQFAYNTATSASTGYTPAYLNTGRELHSPGSPAHETKFDWRKGPEKNAPSIQ